MDNINENPIEQYRTHDIYMSIVACGIKCRRDHIKELINETSYTTSYLIEKTPYEAFRLLNIPIKHQSLLMEMSFSFKNTIDNIYEEYKSLISSVCMGTVWFFEEVTHNDIINVNKQLYNHGYEEIVNNLNTTVDGRLYAEFNN